MIRCKIAVCSAAMLLASVLYVASAGPYDEAAAARFLSIVDTLSPSGVTPRSTASTSLLVSSILLSRVFDVRITMSVQFELSTTYNCFGFDFLGTKDGVDELA